MVLDPTWQFEVSSSFDFENTYKFQNCEKNILYFLKYNNFYLLISKKITQMNNFGILLFWWFCTKILLWLQTHKYKNNHTNAQMHKYSNIHS